jgi:hypothetical protein
MMDDLFHDLINRSIVVVYMDDILIFTETTEEHRSVTREVLSILRDNHLYLKAEKCEFECTEVEYLGLVVWKGEIAMDPVKVRGVTEWAIPHTKKDLQGFLGFVNFYQQFIKGFARIAHPLHRLTGKVPWKWTEEEEMAFVDLKTAVTTAPVLTLPRDEGDYRIECDSSDFATGAVLLQLQDGKWRSLGVFIEIVE